MKIFIYYFFIYVSVCLLQFFVGKYINIEGIFPNFVLIAVVFLGLFRKGAASLIISFLFGLTWDVFSMDIFGIRAVIFTIIAYFSGILVNNFLRDKIPVQCAVIFFASFVYSISFNFIFYVLSLHENGYFYIYFSGFLKNALTTIVAPAVFWLLNKITNLLFLPEEV
jgi:rod shape-determining protein MreD